jgi:hypothetical protein
MTSTKQWSGIENFEIDDENLVQVGFRHSHLGHREYVVLGYVKGQWFNEHYDSSSDDNKRLAYSLYYEKQQEITAVNN